VRPDGVHRYDLETGALNHGKEGLKVIDSRLIYGLGVLVGVVPLGELLRVDHHNPEAVSVQLVLKVSPGVSGWDMLEVGGNSGIGCLSPDWESPDVGVLHVVEGRVQSDGAAVAGHPNCFDGCDCSVVEGVVGEDEGGREDSCGCLNDAVGLVEDAGGLILGQFAKVLVVQSVVGYLKIGRGVCGFSAYIAHQVGVRSEISCNNSDSETVIEICKHVHDAVLLSSHVVILNIIQSECNAVANVYIGVVHWWLGYRSVQVDLGNLNELKSVVGCFGEQTLEFGDHTLVHHVDGVSADVLLSECCYVELHHRETISCYSDGDLGVGLAGSGSLRWIAQGVHADC